MRLHCPTAYRLHWLTTIRRVGAIAIFNIRGVPRYQVHVGGVKKQGAHVEADQTLQRVAAPLVVRRHLVHTIGQITVLLHLASRCSLSRYLKVM